MDYSKLSDFEINRAVGEVILKGRWACKPGTAANNTDSWYYGSVDQFVTPYPELPDYCNNPADAWPIILANKIGILWLESESLWSANSPGELEEGCWDWSCTPDHWFDDSNPLRAAMIVFLMMQESER